jgi:predicted N-acetyltransferase YhbS
MSKEVKIRIMNESDIPKIEEIIERTLGPVDASKAKKDMIGQSKGLYADGESFVAETDDEVIGVIGYWRLGHHPKKVAWLDWFAVEIRSQNQGVGSKLLSHMLNELSKKNFNILCCEKSSKDKKAENFYCKHDFCEFGRIEDYWEDGGDLVLLKKEIK